MTIGAAPRPDLTDALRAALGDTAVLEVGALDDLAADDGPPAPAPGGYPLTTRRGDGTEVVADEAWLAPRVSAAVRRAGDLGVDATLLLCAGGFEAVAADGPLVRPFEVAVARLRDLGASRIGVLVPIAGQSAPARTKWTAAGFDAVVEVGPPEAVGAFARAPAGPVDAVVLDFVGHPRERVAAAVAIADPVPVVDLLAVAIDAMAATMRP